MDLFEAMRCAPATRTFSEDAVARGTPLVAEFAFSERYCEPLIP